MYCSVAYACIEEEEAVQLHLLFIVVHAMHVCPDVHLIFLGSGATTSFGTAPGFCFARETNCYPVRQATAREDRVRLGQLRSIDGRMDEPAQHDTNLIGHATIWAQHGLARSVNRAAAVAQARYERRSVVLARSAQANRAASCSSPTPRFVAAGRRPRVIIAGRPRVRWLTLRTPGASHRPSLACGHAHARRRSLAVPSPRPCARRTSLAGHPYTAATRPPAASARRPSPACVPAATTRWRERERESGGWVDGVDCGKSE